MTTGIVYMPVGLAILAARLRQVGHTIDVIDAFGEAPNRLRDRGDLIFRGLTADQTVARIKPGSIVFIYANHVVSHDSVIEISRACKGFRTVVFENTQAVTAYSLRRLQAVFHDAGVEFVLTGEPEERAVELLRAIEAERGVEASAVASSASSVAAGASVAIDGVGTRSSGVLNYAPPAKFIQDLDALPFAAWDLFPLKNYWKLKYAHGPFTSKRYLPLLTSRGCPYPCTFCVIPETNGRKWRARSAKNVVDEMDELQKKLGVSEFHIEDVDPTVNDARTREICEEIIRRNLKVSWKLCAGTKMETIKSEETIELMAKAGCEYISISPETGSERVLKLINKPFDYEKAKRWIAKMKKVGIKSQACFVLGFPGEEPRDRELTRAYARELVRAGVDEIALFIVAPIPGSEISKSATPLKGYQSYSEIHFSPKWRSDYAELNSFRLKLYRSFLIWKLKYNTLAILRQPFDFLLRRFHTKMEMAPFRALHTYFMLKGWTGDRAD